MSTWDLIWVHNEYMSDSMRHDEDDTRWDDEWGHNEDDTRWYMKMKSLANILICWNHINEDVNSKYRMSYLRRSILARRRSLANILIEWNHIKWGHHTP